MEVVCACGCGKSDTVINKRGEVRKYIHGHNMRGKKNNGAWGRLGDKNYMWKGDGASYSALHYWVSYHLGKPTLCGHCGTTEAKKYEWASISRKYVRDLTDWIRLCTSCHHKFDGSRYTMWKTRRASSGKTISA